jgi:arylsulfatase
MVRWPGVVKADTTVNSVISHEDWMPTLLAAAGVPDVKEKLAKGYTANGKDWKVKLDGYNFLPFLKGEVKNSPRDSIFYFSQGGDLNAVRWTDWKVNFAVLEGNIVTGVRQVPGWPLIINLRADPYEKAPHESQMYLRWYADNMWLFVPIQQKVKEFFADFAQFPYQAGSSLTVSNINYGTIRQQEALQRLQKMEEFAPSR